MMQVEVHMSKLVLAAVLAAAAPTTALVWGQSALCAQLQSLHTTPANAAPGRLDVRGEAIIALVPDRATMTLQMQTKGADKLEAQRNIDEQTAALLAALSKAGATSAQLASHATQLQPVYARDRRGNLLYLQVEAWEATRTVTACAHDLAQVTPWQTAAREVGALTVGEVALEASNLEVLKEEARLKAATTARNKGRALAAALGGRLGAPLSIAENASSTTDASVYKRANTVDERVESSVVNGDFAAGTMSVVATVSVTFEVLSDA